MKRELSAAIVLRRWPYSEHSLALRVLTPGRGELPVLAKGVYKPTSGCMGVLDTWALVEIEYGQPKGAEMANLYRARLLDRMSGLGRDPDRLAAAALAAELAELAAPPGPEAAAAFAWLLGSLRELDAGCPLEPFLVRAVLGGLDLLGLAPVLEEEEGVVADGPPRVRWFSAADGGVLPASALRPAAASRLIQPAQLELLRAIRAGVPDAAEQADAADREACLTILGDFLLYHLERPPRAWEILRRRRHPQTSR